MKRYLFCNSNFCVKYTLRRESTTYYATFTVANRWNYIRENNDSFGEFRRKSVRCQSGYLLCNVVPLGGK